MTGSGSWAEDWLDRYGAIDPGGRFAEAQRAGFEAASELLARLAAQWGADGAHVDGADVEGAIGHDGAADPLHALRVESMRSLDATIELTRRLFEGTLDLADAAVRRGAGAGAADGDAGPATIEVVAGGVGTARLWVHHRGAPVGPLRWRVLGPSTGRGDVGVARVDPAEVDRLHDGDRVPVTVSIEVPDDAPTGTAHGLVLADGADDLALAFRLVVRPAPSSNGSTAS